MKNLLAKSERTENIVMIKLHTCMLTRVLMYAYKHAQFIQIKLISMSRTIGNKTLMTFSNKNNSMKKTQRINKYLQIIRGIIK